MINDLKITVFTTKVSPKNQVTLRDVFNFTKILHYFISPNTANIFTNA